MMFIITQPVPFVRWKKKSCYVWCNNIITYYRTSTLRPTKAFRFVRQNTKSLLVMYVEITWLRLTSLGYFVIRNGYTLIIMKYKITSFVLHYHHLLSDGTSFHVCLCMMKLTDCIIHNFILQSIWSICQTNIS